MTIESVNFSAALGDVDFVTLSNGTVEPFSARLQSELSAVNTKLETAEAGLRDLAAGKQGNIHHVMLALEDARMSFQLLAQVRNKVLESYQELLRMQI
ncbi:MAG: flagellar hook-basal body complex protein FliE [Rhodocyclales bacterium]|nr:flagellar hook-basal body complex protein FliE [Rhodocyclales bacterium]